MQEFLSSRVEVERCLQPIARRLAKLLESRLNLEGRPSWSRWRIRSAGGFLLETRDAYLPPLPARKSRETATEEAGQPQLTPRPAPAV